MKNGLVGWEDKDSRVRAVSLPLEIGRVENEQKGGLASWGKVKTVGWGKCLSLWKQSSSIVSKRVAWLVGGGGGVKTGG